MIRRLIPSTGLFAMLLLSSVAWSQEAAPGATSLVPDDALIVLRITNPRALIEQAAQPQIVSFVQSLPPYQQAMAEPQTKQVLGLIHFFENKYDAKLPELLGQLLGGGITLAVMPNDQNLMIVEAENGQMLQEVHDFFLTIAKGEAKNQGDPDRIKSAEYRGVQGWSFTAGESHAIAGNQLLLANKPEALKAALDRRAGEGGGSIADSAGFTAAEKAVGADAVATLYADMRVLKQLPGFQQALEQDQNPLVRLLFAPLLAGVNQATWLAAGITLDAQNVTVKLLADRGDGQPSPLNSFALPATEDEGAMPQLQVPRQIAGISLFRDLHKFYASKDELFGERTSGLIFFENMMGIFFSGKDLTEEVLAATLPDVRLVVAEQQYGDTTGTPAMQLPGFALVVKLRDPEAFHEVAEEAWQKAIGLINFTRGQKALPGLIIDKPIYEGTKYTIAAFAVADEPDKDAVDVRFNFQPALAVYGDHLIMSSTDALTRDLIDALAKESQQQVAPESGKHSLAVVQGAALASILQANRGAMVRQSMVEKGTSRETAEQETDALLAAIRYLDRVQVEAGEQDGLTAVTLSLGYRLP